MDDPIGCNEYSHAVILQSTTVAKIEREAHHKSTI